jgi:glycine/D-amino acid oxidase-like deaminating enzyme
MKVIVVGAGVIGAGVARSLALTGQEVLVLDRRGVGAGTTSTTFAWTNHPDLVGDVLRDLVQHRDPAGSRGVHPVIRCCAAPFSDHRPFMTRDAPTR